MNLWTQLLHTSVTAPGPKRYKTESVQNWYEACEHMRVCVRDSPSSRLRPISRCPEMTETCWCFWLHPAQSLQLLFYWPVREHKSNTLNPCFTALQDKSLTHTHTPSHCLPSRPGRVSHWASALSACSPASHWSGRYCDSWSCVHSCLRHTKTLLQLNPHSNVYKHQIKWRMQMLVSW